MVCAGICTLVNNLVNTMLTTEAFLMAFLHEHGTFSPKIGALLKGWQPSEEL
jgi:hypothetical protein